MTNPLVSIIIVSRRANSLEKSIKNLLLQSYLNYELIIIWNGNIDQMHLLENKFKRHTKIKFITDGSNNVSKGRNIGINKSVGAFIVFTDDDCIQRRDWIVILLGELIKDNKIGAVGSLRDAENKENYIAYLCQLSDIKIGSMEEKYNAMDEKNIYICTSSAMIRRNVLNEIKNFDEHLISGEDSDLSVRIKEAGYKIKLVPRANITHMHPESIHDATIQQLWYGFGDYSLWKKHNWGGTKSYMVRFLQNITDRFFSSIIYSIKNNDIKLLLTFPFYIFIMDFSRFLGYVKASLGHSVNVQRDIK